MKHKTEPPPLTPAAPPTPAVWLSSDELADRLGCSLTTLRNLRRAGILRPGTHYRRVGTSPTSAVRYDLLATEQALRAATANLEPLATFDGGLG